MTIKSRLAILEKTTRGGLSWRQFVECDDPEKLPADLHKDWRTFVDEITANPGDNTRAAEHELLSLSEN
jgi:hypothetical protein